MRKITALLLALLILIMSGCGTAREAPAETSAPTETAETHAAHTAGNLVQPAEEPTDREEETQELEPTETSASAERAGCIYCGANAPDVPITEDGVCQSCYAALQHSMYTFCVDCGTMIYDPCSFDPYHCTGCGSSSGVDCSECGKHVPGWESIQWMCRECYWSSGSGSARCCWCGGLLDSRTEAEILCSRCWIFVKDSESRSCSDCGELHYDWEMYNGTCFSCSYHSGMYPSDTGSAGNTCSVCGTVLLPDAEDTTRCEECTYCALCGSIAYSEGRRIDGVYMCPNCYEPMYMVRCDYCEEYYLSIDYDDCPNKIPCDWCGTLYHFMEMFERVCFNCDDPSGGSADVIYCSICGTDCSYRGTIDGMCDECYYLYNTYCDTCGVAFAFAGMEDGVCDMCIYFSAPNVFCPNCDHSWFTTGVGIEGFTCSQCGYNF